MNIVLPNLTDKEFNTYNDVNQMRRIIDDFLIELFLQRKQLIEMLHQES